MQTVSRDLSWSLWRKLVRRWFTVPFLPWVSGWGSVRLSRLFTHHPLRTLLPFTGRKEWVLEWSRPLLTGWDFRFFYLWSSEAEGRHCGWVVRAPVTGAECPGFKTQLVHGILSLCSTNSKWVLGPLQSWGRWEEEWHPTSVTPLPGISWFFDSHFPDGHWPLGLWDNLYPSFFHQKLANWGKGCTKEKLFQHWEVNSKSLL